MAKGLKISDLVHDDKNFNKGTEFGNSLIEKSLRKFGAGRSILIDKNNRIIAGNKTIENASAIGLEDLQIVESDGTRIIAVKRTDIDLDSKAGRELALADNATAKANIDWDIETTFEVANEFGFDAGEWGVNDFETASEVDYSILDDEDVEDQLKDMTNGVKKAIQIEFEAEHYEEAYELVKFWREQGGYVGGMIMDFLKAEKEKL
jgi:sporulation protein YlmC with PRC-barrel domain